MSGREVAVGAGLFIMAVGILADQANSPGAPAVKAPAPRPVPTHTEIIHEVTTHIVTHVVAGSPVNGLEITLMVIMLALISAGVTIAVHIHRRPE
jgi:hypothetical protein